MSNNYNFIFAETSSDVKRWKSAFSVKFFLFQKLDTEMGGRGEILTTLRNQY